MTVQTLRCGRSWKRLPENKSWEYMHSEMLSSDVTLSQLRVLKLDGLHLPCNFFSSLAQSTPCLNALTLSGVQLNAAVDLITTTEHQNSTTLPLQQLKMIRCQFNGCEANEQNNKFTVGSEYFVRFPNLTSFEYISAECESSKRGAPIRCPWPWLLSAINIPQVTDLSLGYGPLYSFRAYSLLPHELKHLKGFSQLTSIKLEVKLCDDVMEVLLKMPQIKRAELHMHGARLQSNFSKRAWELDTLVVCQDNIDRQWINAMMRMPLDSPRLVEVASGNYSISLDDQEVPAFLALAKRITWPASRGEFTYYSENSIKTALLMLPYIDYLNMVDLDLDSELASALAKEAQHRVIAVRSGYYPPEHAKSVLPVLLERKRVLVLGPQPTTPQGPVDTWDTNVLWQLLVDFHTKVLKQYHWSDRPEEYCQFERGFRRTDITCAMLDRQYGFYTESYPNDPVKCIYYTIKHLQRRNDSYR